MAGTSANPVHSDITCILVQVNLINPTRTIQFTIGRAPSLRIIRDLDIIDAAKSRLPAQHDLADLRVLSKVDIHPLRIFVQRRPPRGTVAVRDIAGLIIFRLQIIGITLLRRRHCCLA
ncbi:hypothetical protein D3C76_1393870 [compost metagenome]